tara:strand:+ start:610 stop:1215 length:606 start_codon:yes stop_codon:yes gene_type:complete
MAIFDENPNLIFDNIKNLLVKGVKERNHPFHTPIFSNIDKNDNSNARIVVLRKFDDKSLILNFHTDYRSPKILELKKNNKSFFVFYDYKIKIQLRINTISYIQNQNDITQKAWKETRLFSRKCYLTEKFPSSKTSFPEDGIPDHLKGVDPTKDESEKGYNNFTVIENKIKNIDWLYLASSGHRRLNINIENKIIKFNWLIP